MLNFSPQQLLNKLSTVCTSKQQLWVAYSGGLDSHVLLYTVAQLQEQFPNLKAIHIHHGLHPQADNWAKHCQSICQNLNINLQIIKVKIDKKSRESLENCARIARYQAIKTVIAPNDVVLTAQHADDQAETLLLQLLRGSGVPGLAAMPTKAKLGQAWLIRPLLEYTRLQLHEYAQQVQLKWIEDSSNQDIRFARNFLRHKVMPNLRENWPQTSYVFARAAQHQAEADELMQDLAKIDWQTCQTKQFNQLQLTALGNLSTARQHNLLRFWLKKLNFPIPSTAQLQHICHDVLQSKLDRQPLVRWQGAEVRRYHNILYAMPNLPMIPNSSQYLDWKLPMSLQLPLGKLVAQQHQGKGIVIPKNSLLKIGFRQGGEKIRLHGQQHTVKKLLQAKHILPWHRKFIPFIFLENQLIAIANVAIHDNFIAKQEQIAWDIKWKY